MIHGKLVRLRAPEAGDAQKLHQWANAEELSFNLGGWHFPYSRRSVEEWIAGLDNNDMRDQHYCIEDPEGRLVGTANLLDIDWKNRTAFHDLMLGPAGQGRGYGVDAEFALLRYAFDELGLERLDGDVIGPNKRALRLSEKCGYQVEGVRKGWYNRRGQRFDKVLVGITRESYHRTVADLGYWVAGPVDVAPVPREPLAVH